MPAGTATLALFSTVIAAGLFGISSASAATPHPPGPDRCWSLQNQQWVWVCSSRERPPQIFFFEPSETGSAYTDPGYPDRNYSDPGYYDPSYYNTVPLFYFDLPTR
jgi:hypothetical protein